MTDEENREAPKLTALDLGWVLVGIILLYLVLGYTTAWLMSLWGQKRELLYFNGFLTQSIFFLIVWSLVRYRKKSWADLGWLKTESRNYFPSILRAYALTWIINIFYGLYIIYKGYTLPESDVYAQLLGDTSPLSLLLNLILAGILAPILEETVFRGVIFGGLRTYFGKLTSAVLSAAIFSGLHFQLYGFFPRFVLGLVLAYLYQKFSSLYPAIYMHAMNNIVAIALVSLTAPGN